MSKLKAAPSTLTEATGHQMAVAMLQQVAKHWQEREQGVADADLGDLWKREQSRILRTNLKAVERLGNEAVTRGFFAVLTDFIGFYACDDNAAFDVAKRYSK